MGIVYLLVASWFPSCCYNGISETDGFSKEERIIHFALESGKSKGEQDAGMNPDDTVLLELVAESARDKAPGNPVMAFAATCFG